EGETMTNETI
ncbi:hypothetical protein C1I82_02725, partial [Helicobacter pylori]